MSTTYDITPGSEKRNLHLYKKIAQDLQDIGYSIQQKALPQYLSTILRSQVIKFKPNQFYSAGIGRGTNLKHLKSIRSDNILWVNSETDAEAKWLNWANDLKSYLNCSLFLGLSTFESHFSHYTPGSFYQRHLDSFKDFPERKLTLITYLNEDWSPEDGGQLILYTDEDDNVGIQIPPLTGTVVVFLSQDFQHEVLPAKRDRYAITGWFSGYYPYSARITHLQKNS